MALSEREELELLELEERERGGQSFTIPRGPAIPPPRETTVGGVLTEGARGLGRAGIQTLGDVLDTPARAVDLGVAGYGAVAGAFGGQPPDLPMDPNEATRMLAGRFPGLAADPNATGAEKFAGTAAEMTGQGLLYGGPSAFWPSVAAGTVGAAGEAALGPHGRLLSLAVPGVSLGLDLAKYVARGSALRAQARARSLEDAGITPTTADLGTRPGVVQKSLEATPLGYVVGSNRAAQRAQEVEQAVERVAPANIPTGGERFAMGRTIEEGLTNWKARWTANYRTMRGVTERHISPDTPVPVPGFLAALQKSGKAIDDPEISALLEPQTAAKLAEVVRQRAPTATPGWPFEGPPVLSWRTVEQIKTRIGNMAFDSRPALVGDIETRGLKDIYRAIGQDQATVAGQISPEAARSFAKQNAYYSAGMSRVDDYLGALYRKAGHPEQIAQLAMSTAARDTERLRTLMKSLTPTERVDLANAAIRDMAKAKPGAVGDMSAETFLTEYRKMSPRGKDALFGHSATLKQDLDSLEAAVKIIRETNRILPNPSGTAALATGGAHVAGVATAIATGQPLLAGAIVAGIFAEGGAAKLMNSPRFVHWLASGVKETFPASRQAAHLGQFANILQAEDDPVRQQAMLKFFNDGFGTSLVSVDQAVAFLVETAQAAKESK